MQILLNVLAQKYLSSIEQGRIFILSFFHAYDSQFV
jgi:hypothetical protein